MRKNGYKRRWLCGVLALMSGFVLPGAVQANSGLSDTMQAIDGPNYNYYVGANGASNNAVNVDESVEDAGIIGGYTSPAEGNVKAEHNQVTVNGSINIGGEVAGGYADSASGSAEANDNTVTVDGNAFIDGEIYGGWAYSEESSARADNNEVTVHGNIEGLYCVEGGYVYAADDAAAENNRVTMTGGTVYGDAYGGWAFSENGVAKSDNNTVWLSKDAVIHGSAVGGLAYEGADGAEANHNNVILDGGTVGEDIYGGYAASGSGSSKANDNQVTMSAGEVNGFINGGYAKSDSGSAEAGNNSVTVSGGDIRYSLHGGYAWSAAGNAAADENTVTIDGGTVRNHVYGGYAYSEDNNGGEVTAANQNRVAVSSGMVKGFVYGGCVESVGSSTAMEHNTNHNIVTISGGTVQGSIYGGSVMGWNGTSEANNNSVIISGGTVKSDMGAFDIYGGWARGDQETAANQNNVIISGGTVVAEKIYGGLSSGSVWTEAISNSVTVSGEVEAKKTVYGGWAYSGSDHAAANDNRVAVSRGIFHDAVYGGYAKSDSGDAEAVHNGVDVSGNAEVTGMVAGGYATSGFYDPDAGGPVSVNVAANDNSVTVNGNAEVTGTVAGGYAASESGNASAKGNSVAISGGIFQNFVYGGYAKASGRAEADSNSLAVSGNAEFQGDIVGGYAAGDSSKVSNNGVTVSEGTFTDIYGGMASGKNSAEANGNHVTLNGGSTGIVLGGLAYSETGSTTADSNSVTISGGTVTGKIYGGYADSLYGTNKATDNKVILSGTADVSGADLYGSNLSAEGTNNNLVINNWSGAVNSLNNFDQLEVRAVAGGQNLTDGSNLQLIKANSITGCEFDGQTVNGIQAGVALTVDGKVSVSEDNTVSVIASDVRASDQTVIATESRAASVAAVGRGAEAVTDSLDTLRGSGEGLSTFASIIGSRSRYNTGSHADVNGWNGIVGTAWTRELTSGTLSCGAFYENGGGSYDTHNTINGRTYRGDGDTVYNGGGLLLRWETNGGTYTEASLRAGMVKNEVGPSLEFAGNRYGFKTENNYYGGHVGIGRIMERDDGDAWDIYGKYFHMHHEGDTVTIAGDEFAFDSVNSDRLRVGARYLDRKNGRFTGYYGLAYEYEFSGDTGGTANHHAMYTPSLQGSTVIGEIGFRGTPGEDSPWSFEVSLRGYAGKQEGISGAVTAAYSF